MTAAPAVAWIQEQLDMVAMHQIAIEAKETLRGDIDAAISALLSEVAPTRFARYFRELSEP